MLTSFPTSLVLDIRTFRKSADTLTGCRAVCSTDFEITLPDKLHVNARIGGALLAREIYSQSITCNMTCTPANKCTLCLNMLCVLHICACAGMQLDMHLLHLLITRCSVLCICSSMPIKGNMHAALSHVTM